MSITNVYYLWRIETSHIFDLAYFIAFAFRYQTDHHRKGPIYLGPYVTHLARHFGLLNTPEQSSTLTLVGQMPPQDISSMIHIRMIDLRRRVDLPQNRLFQSDVEQTQRISLMMFLPITRIHLSHYIRAIDQSILLLALEECPISSS